MLKLKNITKTYITGSLKQDALKDVNISFRDSEFVAILGHSGSGKTTLLNIIGGLDQYTSGDLIIDGISTTKFKNKNWDAYRNHTIGFVFQSYNLIPHQTVLENVELALTLSGVSRKERKQRAIKALEEVGLKDHINKKPNQISGGQAQRVAIARALINNPNIILADEPTGALDSDTSTQVMNILKEIAKDRLVIMVTHNPELAEGYANRIVRLVDGRVVSDTNPYDKEEKIDELKKIAKNKSMSFFTAFSLSLKNLLTKKARTIMVAFAGSIGIMGIALILSLSTGFQNYIDEIQETTLSSYPLTINSETADTTSAILSIVSDRNENDATGTYVKEHQYLTTMFSSIGSNDLKSFKGYLEGNMDEVNRYASQVRYSYSISPNIYTIDAADKLTKLNPSSFLSSIYSSSAAGLLTSYTTTTGIFSEMSDDIDSLKGNFDVLAGRWPEKYDELIIVLSEPNAISDLLVYSLGLRDTNELKTLISELMAGNEVTIHNEPMTFTYDDLMNLELRLINPSDLYEYNEEFSIYEDMSSDNEYMKNVYDNSLKLKIVGVVCGKEKGSSLSLSPGVAYKSDLTKYVIECAAKSEIVKHQLENKDINVISNKRFDDQSEEKQTIKFEDMITIDEELLKEAFTVNVDSSSIMDQNQLQAILTEKITAMSSSVTSDIQTRQLLVDTMDLLINDIVTSYINDSSNQVEMYGTQLINFDDEHINTYKEKYLASGVIEEQTSKILADYSMPNDILTPIYKASVPGVLDAIKGYLATLETPTTVIDVGSLTTYSGVLINSYEDVLYSNLGSSLDQVATGLCKAKASTAIASNSMTMVADIMTPIQNMFSGELFSVDTSKFAAAFKFDMSQDKLQRIMLSLSTDSSESTLSSNLLNFGYQDIDEPTMIYFYFKNFENKENFITFLDKYNDAQTDENKVISYTDITGILMSSVKTIVDAVSYVLIAFVSISLIVSSIMIGVITLISVMERIKEIGILRAIGASKRDISRVFNVETFIIGLLSGCIGIGCTWLLLIPINEILHSATGIETLTAVLPNEGAIVLMLISVILTFIAGLIPSRSAANKNPVEALRTE